MRYNLSNIMSEAHSIKSITGCTISEALKKAWLNEKLSRAMRERVCHFFYQKVSGEIREAYGTMMPSCIEGLVNGRGSRKPNTKTYFDTEKGEFRCYKSFNIISFA